MKYTHRHNKNASPKPALVHPLHGICTDPTRHLLQPLCMHLHRPLGLLQERLPPATSDRTRHIHHQVSHHGRELLHTPPRLLHHLHPVAWLRRHHHQHRIILAVFHSHPHASPSLPLFPPSLSSLPRSLYHLIQTLSTNQTPKLSTPEVQTGNSETARRLAMRGELAIKLEAMDNLQLQPSRKPKTVNKELRHAYKLKTGYPLEIPS
jgi:hypothetical protein